MNTPAAPPISAVAAVGSRILPSSNRCWVETITRSVCPPPPPPPLPSIVRQPQRRRQPSTETVLARLEWLLRGGWPYLEWSEGVRLFELFDGGGPFTPDDVVWVNRVVRRVEAASGCAVGTEVPL